MPLPPSSSRGRPKAPLRARVAEGKAADLPQSVVTVTADFLHVLGIDGEVLCRDRRGDETPHLWIEVLTRESGLLIGERGTTLRAFEHILRLVLRPVVGSSLRVMVDVNAYRVRQLEILRRRAQSAAERARLTGRAVVFEPMSAADRRIIHVTLAMEEGVATESRGEGAQRRVVVRPADSLA